MSSTQKEVQDLKNKFSQYQKNEEELSRKESISAGKKSKLLLFVVEVTFSWYVWNFGWHRDQR